MILERGSGVRSVGFTVSFFSGGEIFFFGKLRDGRGGNGMGAWLLMPKYFIRITTTLVDSADFLGHCPIGDSDEDFENCR